MIGGLLAAYGIAEAVEGYGFLAVFVGAVAARQIERGSDYHARSHHFIDQLEAIVLVGMLLGFGGLLAGGVLDALTVPAALVALAVVFVVRPLAGIAGCSAARSRGPAAGPSPSSACAGWARSTTSPTRRATPASTGIDVVWATAAFAILVSIVVHGLTAERASWSASSGRATT